jgi:hypothetical protein
MEGLAREFVRRREVLQSSGGGLRVPEDLRRMAVRFGLWAMERGESLGATAGRLGIHRATLGRWLEQDSTVESSEVREVVVRKADSVPELGVGAKLILVTPEGFRIEGLSRGEVAELVRSLR